MNAKTLIYLIKSDLYRYYGDASLRHLFKEFVWGIGFKYSFWMRLCRYFRQRRLLYLPFFLIARLMLQRYMFKFGIQVNYMADVGPGFYIGHFGEIVVSSGAKIGRNCNISQGVTVGVVRRGKNVGVPSIGDNVYIGPGAKIIGSITVGSNAAIGANAVIVKDVPDNAVVVGVPGKVLSYEGSHGYINRTDYNK